MTIIEKTIAFVKEQIQANGISHDWYHIERVWKNAQIINSQENLDPEIVELSALLHDVTDRKYYLGTPEEGRLLLFDFLTSLAVNESKVEQILNIIYNMSFSKEGTITCEEQKVVQDADRLDAIGAIGIARCIAYAAEIGNPIHIPGVFGEHNKISEYRKKGSASAISHFYDKLLHIKDRMLTSSGKRIAHNRHAFMIQYLEQFKREWSGSQ